ncbi:MAG TPA: hypothetical protein VFA18_04780 [Gemmataceae bacterium]|nr:hypothetical protein [Gemmataceae bacterium]
MPRWLALVALTGLFVSSVGCFVNTYSSNPNRRMNELMNQSEDLRDVENIWERFWFEDQPSHMTIERVHGGIE